MRGRFASNAVVALACALVAGVSTLATSPTPARLVAVKPSTSSGRPAVVIEASAPVAYATSQPDPLTVLVLMRHVSVDARLAAFEPVGSTPVAHVAIEPGTDEDGASVAKVRLHLSTPATPEVRSARESIVVTFDTPAGIAAGADRVHVVGTGTPRSRRAPAAVSATPLPGVEIGVPEMPPSAAKAGAPYVEPAPAPAATRGTDLRAARSVAAPATASADERGRRAAARTATPGDEPEAGSPGGQTVAVRPTGAQASSSSTSLNLAATPVSFDFQGVDLRAVLRTFAEITGLNVVIDPAVKGEVDVSLRDVPADQALDIILRTNQLGYTVDGTIVRIAPTTKLRQEEEDKRRLADAKALAGQTDLVTRTLSYAKADDVDELVKGVLSPRGRTAVDDRTNTLVMQDLPEYLARAGQLLDKLDQPELQVEIEARIVQTRTTFARELGLKWGFFGQVAPELGNTTPLAFPNNGSLGGAVGLPTPNPPTGVTKLTLGSINGAFNLDVELQALQREGKLNILLTPRVVTQNNVKATIKRGEEIPYTTLVAQPAGNGTLIQAIPTVQFKTAALVLDVTPRITSANTVILDVDVDNGSRGDFIISGNVSINTQRATTRVLVNDGATTVIGGIQAKTERDAEGRVPGLARIPVFGRLFKNEQKELTDDEIIIFITPRILKMPQARVMAAGDSQQH